MKAGLSDFFLLALLLFVVAEVGRLLLPLSGPILAAIVIGVAFYPTHQRLSQMMHKRSPNTSALLTDLLVLLFLIVPSALLIWILTNEAESLAPLLKQGQKTVQNIRQGGGVESIGAVRHIRDWLYLRVGIQPAQFREQIIALADTMIQSVSSIGAALAKNSLRLLIGLLIMLFTLFFLFRDGAKMSTGFQSYIPLQPELKANLADRLQSTIVGAIRGWFLTAVIQGLTAALGYFIVGVPGVALFGVLTAITGLIPSVGTALVWFPIALFYLVRHAYFKGSFLMVWGILIVGLLDNFMRPYLMQNKADLPFLAIFFAILGGIEVWGTKGIVLGPILLAITPILADAYRERFLTNKSGAEKK